MHGRDDDRKFSLCWAADDHAFNPWTQLSLTCPPDQNVHLAFAVATLDNRSNAFATFDTSFATGLRQNRREKHSPVGGKLTAVSADMFAPADARSNRICVFIKKNNCIFVNSALERQPFD